MTVPAGTGAYEGGGNLDAINTATAAINTTITAVNSKLSNSDGIVLLASGVVTSNGFSSDQTNLGARGLKLFIVTGTFGGSESTMTVTIQGKDPISGVYYTILTSASLVASKDPSSAAGNLLTVYPGLTAVANQVVSDVLPKTWRVTYQASAWGTGGSTLGIAAALIV